MDSRMRFYGSFRTVTQFWKVALLGLIILSLIFGLNHFKLSSYFPIKTVRVYGIHHLDQQEVQSLLLPLLKGGFLTVNVDRIKEHLSQIPWVANTIVRRHWPDQIDITIIEKNAIAYWNESALLSQTGELFNPRLQSYPNNLPKFIGPDGKQVVMLQYFNEINQIMTPLGVNIARLELTPYLFWKITLNNGITLHVEEKDILTRLTHFVKVYPKIVGHRAEAVEYIDLRYPNGMAIRWRIAQSSPHEKPKIV